MTKTRIFGSKKRERISRAAAENKERYAQKEITVKTLSDNYACVYAD